ncbi:MAG: carboxypeptidase regulatory-like domain-containing protein, partial [Acidobacteria bacterium]|nr:carboxypeptidase regulatory-like domain-containing protein [Acidobacteriota bacterium]
MESLDAAQILRLCASFFLALGTLSAQSNQASVSGVVSDAQNAVIPGANVTATNTATGVRTVATTNDTGFYAIPNLPVGVYTLAVEHAGFRRYVREGIVLNTGQTLGLDVRMELGAVTETVNVAGETPLVETRTSDVTQLIESKSVENLPLGNRRTLNVVRMTGAALFVDYPNNPGNANPNFSLAGGRAQSQMAWIDGGAAQNMRLGVGQINLDPPVEVVEEIKVLTNSYAAEYGGSAGGVIVETTKSGTNRFHGSAYEYLRNDALDAPGFFATVQNGAKVKPRLRYNVFGGTAGGPIRRDRTFFFFGYEGQRLRTGGVDTLTVPTDLQRAGDFSQTFNQARGVIPIYDPATTQPTGNTFVRNPFPDNRIPANRLDPVALNLMKFYPLPNRPPDNVAGVNNFRANYVPAFTANFYMVKVDHNLSGRDKLTGRYLFNGGPGTNTSIFPDPGADSRAHAENRQQYTYAAWTRTITPAMVSDFRFTYINRVFHNMTNGLGGNYPEKLGLKGVPNNAFPQFSPAGFTSLGSNAQERRQFPIEQQQFVENLAWTRGRHAMKFGFEGRRSRNHEINLSTASGAFGFSTQPTGLPGNAATGNGLASLLLGFPTTFSESQTQELDRSSWYLGAFAQDDWTVSPSLTINLGLRLETDTPIVDVNNRMNGFDPAQINPVSGTPGVVKFMGLDGFRTSPYSTDWNNFGPRFGFAWKPLGSTHTVVRGGFGIFFAHPLDSGQPTAASLGFSVSAALNSPDNGITAPFYLRDGVPGVTVAAPVLNDSFGAVRVGQNANTSISYFETNRRTGYSEQFNLGVQRELPGSTVIEATVLGNFSRKLASTNLSTNQILPALLGPDHQSQKDRPFPQFSDVAVIAPPLGVSNYYAAMLRVQKRYSHGLNLGGHYAFSRFLDNTNDSGTTLGNNGGPYSNYYNR